MLFNNVRFSLISKLVLYLPDSAGIYKQMSKKFVCLWGNNVKTSSHYAH